MILKNEKQVTSGIYFALSIFLKWRPTQVFMKWNLHLSRYVHETTDRKVFQLSHALYVFITWWLKPKLWSLKCHVKFSFLLSIYYKLVFLGFICCGWQIDLLYLALYIQAFSNPLEYKTQQWNSSNIANVSSTD